MSAQRMREGEGQSQREQGEGGGQVKALAKRASQRRMLNLLIDMHKFPEKPTTRRPAR